MHIVGRKVLAETRDTRVIKIEVNAALIASTAKAGQFVVLMVKEEGERIPLTVVDRDEHSGTITLIFQELGFLLGKPRPPIYPYRDSLRRRRPLVLGMIGLVAVIAAVVLFDFAKGGP